MFSYMFRNHLSALVAALVFPLALFLFLIQTFSPRGIMVDKEYQKKLVLEQRYKALDMADSAIDTLDSKSLSLLRSSALILALLGFFGGTTIVTGASADYYWLVLSATVVCAIAFFLMIIILLISWHPADTYSSGTNNWDKIFDDRINVTEDECYNQILADCTDTFEKMRDVTISKGNLISRGVALFALQLVCLIVIIIFA